MLLLSGVVENGYMVPILAILGPMADLFICPQVSFDLLQATCDLFCHPWVCFNLPKATSDLLGHPRVRVHLLSVCLDLKQAPNDLFICPLVHFDLLQAPSDLLGHPWARPLIAVPLYSDPPMDILYLDPSFHILTLLFKWERRCVHFDLCKQCTAESESSGE